MLQIWERYYPIIFSKSTSSTSHSITHQYQNRLLWCLLMLILVVVEFGDQRPRRFWQMVDVCRREPSKTCGYLLAVAFVAILAALDSWISRGGRCHSCSHSRSCPLKIVLVFPCQVTLTWQLRTKVLWNVWYDVADKAEQRHHQVLRIMKAENREQNVIDYVRIH